MVGKEAIQNFARYQLQGKKFICLVNSSPKVKSSNVCIHIISSLP